MEEVNPEEVLVEETPEVVAESAPEAEVVAEETPEVVEVPEVTEEVAVEEPTPTPAKKSRKASVEPEVVTVEEPVAEPQVVQTANPNRVVKINGQHISIK